MNKPDPNHLKAQTDTMYLWPRLTRVNAQLVVDELSVCKREMSVKDFEVVQHGRGMFARFDVLATFYGPRCRAEVVRRASVRMTMARSGRL